MTIRKPLRVFLVCVATALGLAPSAGAQQTPAGRLQAFLLTSSPDSFADMRAHLDALGAIYPTYFECATPSGALVGATNPEVDAYAGLHQLAELPRYTCQVGPVVHRILTEPRLRERTLAQLVALAGRPAYAGLNLDLENDGSGDRGALSLFVAALAHRLHAERRRLAVDVVGVTAEPIPRPAAGFYNYRALSANADNVFVMAWGLHWAGSAPGPVAPLSFVERVASYVASLPHADRFVLGAEMYGLDWPMPNGSAVHARGTALQYASVLALARSVAATPVRDRSVDEMTFTYARAGVTHRVWYMDARAIADRLRIARAHGLGAGVWRLGAEDQALWSSAPVVEGLT